MKKTKTNKKGLKMSTQDSDSKVSNTDANKIDSEASSIAKNIVGLEQNNTTKASGVEQSTPANTIQPKPAVQKILAPAKPHISIVNGEASKEEPKVVSSSSKKKGFSIPFFGNKNRSKVKLGSGSKINKKFALIPIALIAVFGSYLIVSSFAASPPLQGNDGLFTPLKHTVIDSPTVGENKYIDVQVGGKGGVPTSYVSSVMLLTTALETTSSGHAAIWATGEKKPNTSNINFTKGNPSSNTIASKISSDGKIRLLNSNGTTKYSIAVIGYYSAANGPKGMHYNAVNPSRILDTRDGNGGYKKPVEAGQSINVQITGKGGVPRSNERIEAINNDPELKTVNRITSETRAVSINLTIDNTDVNVANDNITNKPNKITVGGQEIYFDSGKNTAIGM
ncbi:hypothetical protein KBC85_03545, partial [Candidatus Saccharibacteria bacterium]|nr:hypothetical protein [Candidatus Saccharibacteria bacterium]